jgi:ubiquitin-conjugating enzyme E2 R
MTFTEDYPYQPPTFRFLIPIYHPNIYPDGRLCISILHTPGEDVMSGEQACERWTPMQGVESVARSILVLLDMPEVNSPANVDASVTYRDNRPEYDRRAKELVEKSKGDIPAGYVMPTTLEPPPPPKPADDDAAFWAESDEELDFGGSDTGDEDEDMGEFDEDGEEASDDDDA